MAFAILAAAAPGAAAGQAAPAPPPVDVIEVSGRIDAIERDFIGRSIDASARAGSQVLVIQLDSPGSVLPAAELGDLAARIRASAVPVAVWVGPTGSTAFGGAVRLVRAAAVSGMANGASIGRFAGPCPECPGGDRLASGRTFGAEEARDLDLVDHVTPTLGDFIVSLDGAEIGGRRVQTARVVDRDGQPRREPVAQVRFAKLALVERVLHATTTPWIAYLLLVAGVLLVLFEYYSAGVGLAGLTGAVSLALAAYGLAALDASPLGLGLLGLAVFGFAVDVQAGTPRTWTAIGTLAFVLGSAWLFPSAQRVPWLALVLVLAGTLLFVLRAMPTMVRARFSTSSVGREAIVGEAGEAASAIDRAGTVRVRGGLWPARAAGAGPIAAGTGIRVVAIDGLVLEVERAGDGPQAPPPAGM